MPLDPQIAELLALADSGTPLHELSPARARGQFRALMVTMRPPESVPVVGSVEEAEVPGADGPLRARIYQPDVHGAVPTVLLFHGGGWVIGDLDTHDSLARAICAGVGAVVVSVDYRLAPEHPFPAAVDDALAVTRHVRDHLADYGGDDRLAVAGDSAGGNLSAIVAQRVPGLAAQLLIYPATDLAGDHPSRTENGEGYFLDLPMMAWFAEQYLAGHTDLTDPRLSPIGGELAGLPPAVVVTAEFDPLRDEGVAYAEALAAAGVRVDAVTYPSLIHGFADMGPWSATAQAATDDAIARFVALLDGGATR